VPELLHWHTRYDAFDHDPKRIYYEDTENNLTRIVPFRGCEDAQTEEGDSELGEAEAEVVEDDREIRVLARL
jgi:hypothetical protein